MSDCKTHYKPEQITYQLVVGDTGAGGIIQEPPGGTTNSGSTDISC